MFDPLFHLLNEGLTALLSVLWVATYLVPTWAAAYLFKVTAPQVCPRGKDYHDCETEHSFHVLRNQTSYSLLLGLFWPVWLVIGGVWLMVRSVDGAVAVTPMPKRKPTLDPTVAALEEADKTTDQMLNEIEQHWQPPNGGTR